VGACGAGRICLVESWVNGSKSDQQTNQTCGKDVDVGPITRREIQPVANEKSQSGGRVLKLPSQLELFDAF